ncbi:MAG TPA: hypothetical protein VKA68_18790 [bacterium]|nr:hypothetical protein [bacterium]
MLRLAVIGDPIAHSLSPALHQHFMETLGVPGEYERILVRNEVTLEQVVERLRSDQLNGLNITAPWKTTIKEYTDELTAVAERIGAVNTVKVVDGALIGHNTDKDGFYRSLQELLQRNTVSHVGIAGAGGAARAVLLGVLQMAPDEIALLNRTVRNAEDLVESVANGHPVDIQQLTPTTLTDTLDRVELFISTLPPQAHAIFDEATLPGVSSPYRYYYDLVYSAACQQVVNQFAAAGWQSTDGLDMLIYQGISSMEFWLDEPIEEKLELPEIRQLLREEEAKYQE